MRLKNVGGKIVNIDKVAFAQFPRSEGQRELDQIKDILTLPEIEALDLSDELVRKVKEAVRTYNFRKRFIGQSQTGTEIKKELKALKNAASRFSKRWEGLGYIARDAIDAEELELPPELSYKGYYDLGDETAIFCEMIAERAEKAKAEIPKGRKKPDLTWRNFVVTIGSIYQEATGKEPGYSWYPDRSCYKGLFIVLVEKCLGVLQSSVSNRTLGDYVKKLRSAKYKCK